MENKIIDSCLTKDQLMERLNIKKRTFYNLLKEHPSLPKFFVCSSPRYDLDDVITFLKDKGESV